MIHSTPDLIVVGTALNGQEALDKIPELNPDVICTDLHMPKMDGFEVCQQLKNNSGTSAIKIIAISGDKTKGNEERILSCGADQFFAKPVDLKVLINEIRHLIGTE